MRNGDAVKSMLLAVIAAALVAGCSSAAKPTAAVSPQGAVSAARCAQNRAAGTIRYLTGYQFQASASILDVVAADGLGYYRDLCLNVDVKPGTGDTGVNARLAAAGTVALSDVGSESDLLVARSHGVDVVGLATYGHVPIDTLMTLPSITTLSQLVGKTLGQKGILPPSIDAMLIKDGVDVAKIRQVKVGFDPSVLPRGQVQALTGYKSNEPLTLKARGTTVTEWNPEHYGIAGSFGTIIANPGFVAAHRPAVEDFLRATLHAYAYCESHAEQCVSMAAKRSPAGFDAAHNLEVWQTEDSLVRASLPTGLPLGSVDPAETAAEAQVLVETGQLPARPSLAAAFVAAPLLSIYHGDTLVWPAP
jgi:ABC-type nitrate/sulfonate/bicarbonate transport system substrate-binding protein